MRSLFLSPGRIVTAPATRTALVTGVSGQDGSYLAELLLTKGYRVVGTSRAGSSSGRERIASLVDRIEFREVDLTDAESTRTLVAQAAPHEIYHLAAASRVDDSWTRPVQALVANAGSTAHLLEAMRLVAPTARLVVASSCEIYGRPTQSPQSEATPIAPASPYGVSKAAAYWLVHNYRDAHALHAASAILYNHESPRRDEAFVTRKISIAAARIASGATRTVALGNLEGRRDWGFAGDYVDAMWRMLQLDAPCDVVVGTGISHSVRDFCERAFSVVGLDYREHVVSDRALLRPVDTASLVADPRVAAALLGWTPAVDFASLVEMMVSADLERVRAGAGM